MWELNGRKEAFCIKVIFASLVDTANLLVLRRLPIREHLVDLAALQGYFVPLFVNVALDLKLSAAAGRKAKDWSVARCWKRDDEAVAGAAHVAAVAAGDAPHDGQAEAAVEGLEDFFALGLGDAGAGVADI